MIIAKTIITFWPERFFFYFLSLVVVQRTQIILNNFNHILKHCIHTIIINHQQHPSNKKKYDFLLLLF